MGKTGTRIWVRNLTLLSMAGFTLHTQDVNAWPHWLNFLGRSAREAPPEEYAAALPRKMKKVDPDGRPIIPTTATGDRLSFLKKVSRYWGTPYVYGSPKTLSKGLPSTFDCSGFVWSMFADRGCHPFTAERPSTDTMAKDLKNKGLRISCNRAMPADLVIWPGRHVSFVLDANTKTDFSALNAEKGIRMTKGRDWPTCYTNPCVKERR